MNIDSSLESVSGRRIALVNAMFPYVDTAAEDKKEDAEEKRYEDYEEYFDELDRIEEMNRSEDSDSSSSGEDGTWQDGGEPIP